MIDCPVCGGNIKAERDALVGELIECRECGAELEVVGLEPFSVAEAPKEAEDWGE